MFPTPPRHHNYAAFNPDARLLAPRERPTRLAKGRGAPAERLNPLIPIPPSPARPASQRAGYPSTAVLVGGVTANAGLSTTLLAKR